MRRALSPAFAGSIRSAIISRCAGATDSRAEGELGASVAPAARSAFVVESISGLQRLQRELARVSQRDENYESKKRALRATIQVGKYHNGAFRHMGTKKDT
jgi:hypothetical protein